MRESVRIFFACALGALLGALIGLELKSISDWLWLPSALLGGVIGWVLYDIRALGAVIARAWREVINWQPDRLYWRLFGQKLLTSVIVLGYGSALMLIWYAGFILADAGWYTFPTLRTTVYEFYWTFVCPTIFLLTGLATMILFVNMLLYIADAQAEADWHKEYGSLMKIIRTAVLLANPIVLPFTAIYGCYNLTSYGYRGVRWILPRIPLAGRLTGQFCKRTFVLAHNDLRLLCFVDATIGAIAGYFLGSALLGALIGGVSGLLNYWVVSVKILHLAPARARN